MGGNNPRTKKIHHPNANRYGKPQISLLPRCHNTIDKGNAETSKLKLRDCRSTYRYVVICRESS
jgi:hypothetical protein